MDILADLLSLHKEKPEFNENYLRKMAITNFGAGHETMASTLTAAVAMIGSHDTVRQNVMAEVRSIPKLSMDAAGNRLPYTKASIRESMRLHPVVAMSLPRKTPSTGLSVHQLWIPPNTTVGCNPVALHRNADIFGAKPEAFLPERWLMAEPGAQSAAGNVRMKEKYSLNWGGGSRTCPGRNLAELVVLKTIVVLFDEFDMQVAIPPQANNEAYFLSMLSGVTVKFLPKSQALPSPGRER